MRIIGKGEKEPYMGVKKRAHAPAQGWDMKAARKNTINPKFFFSGFAQF
jgi:hypothetical protein